ncbi:DoxX-like family protein [Mariniphaga anaerophila]|uniref:DoxX-like family protein n=1 Tax=Mariniphaga anaerophila TaxID=1484053 RepID=A0A1M4VTM1_9BACT|nr:DoxX family protein [Mariniphaga anaerophila]SHE72152.1 DoxX-like family protein [Mariniphaga anaerophila]
MKYISFILRLAIAVILVQTLYFKFTGHAEAVHIFTVLGAEPVGRIFVGIMELVTAVLLLLPRTSLHGALLTIGLMIGAIGSHLFTPLGIVVQWGGNSDGGLLFTLALSSFLMAVVYVILFHRNTSKIIPTLLFKKQ